VTTDLRNGDIATVKMRMFFFWASVSVTLLAVDEAFWSPLSGEHAAIIESATAPMTAPITRRVVLFVMVVLG
jgi:hypothetical protein